MAALRVIALLAGALAGALASSSAARADDALIAHGSDQTYWIARSRALPGGGGGGGGGGADSTGDNAGGRWVVQSRQILDDRWHAIAKFSEAMQVVSLASKSNDSQLAVLLGNGDWMLAWDSGTSAGPLPSDGAKLVQLAGDATTFWALGRLDPASRPSTQPASANRRSSSAPTTTMTSAVSSGVVLYRQDEGAWRAIEMLPAYAQSAKMVDLAIAGDGRPVVVAAGGGEVRTFVFEPASKRWESVATLAAPANLKRLKLLAAPGPQVLLWLAGGDSAGQVYRLGSMSWSAPVPLVISDTAGSSGADIVGRDIAIAGNSLRLVTLGSNDLWEDAFGLDGKPRGQRVSLMMPAASASEPRQFEWLGAIAAAVLVVVLMNSVRTQGGANDSPIESLNRQGFALAPYGLRFLAGFIDALPLILTAALLVPREELLRGATQEEIVAAMGLPMYVPLAIYIFYTLVSETLWGWTIGKRLCGLRVVTVAGLVPTRRARVVRNLLRLIDLLLMGFPLAMILFSPLRQRTGDMAAETVVVMGTGVKSELAEEPPPPSDPAAS